ncbi:P-loop containing nucleoside triphosphate hydrolase protein [Parasitella parasitica]|nr:P-loop containing nucleoside triphosphate hydrolase protein [Parasitella parasitica]
MTKVFTIGIGGPSCSGKTTATRILCQIVKSTTIIYQDDFYKEEKLIPLDPNTKLANWDCPESVDFNLFAKNIEYAKIHNGQLPEGFKSTEVRNVHDGSSLVSQETFIKLQRILAPLFEKYANATLIFVDGFLLYWDDNVSQQLDCKISFKASYETLKTRRGSRQGYHSLEGYWVDPPDYFDKIVWPEYLKQSEHGETIDDLLAINTDEFGIDETVLKVAKKIVQDLMCE